MNKVIEILMQRDGLSKSEAQRLVLEVRDMIYSCNGSFDAVENILMEELGLEPDYLMDIL